MAEAESAPEVIETHHHRAVAAICAATLALMTALAVGSYMVGTEPAAGAWGLAMAQLLERELGGIAIAAPLLPMLCARDLIARRAALVGFLCRLIALGVAAALVHLALPGTPGGRIGAELGELVRRTLGLGGVVALSAAALLCLLVLYRASAGLSPLPGWLSPPGLPRSDDVASQLLSALRELGVTGRIDGMQRGPRVTTYEFAPDAGIKLARIAGLGSDLTMRLGRPVRVLAPLAGKARVGFELASSSASQPTTVQLRELLEDARWAAHTGALPIAIGRDTAGSPVYSELAGMPHLLIAGATGAGKSVGLNALLASLLARQSPEEMRLLLVDPKRVEFAAYDAIPHLLAPIVSDAEGTTRALRWLIAEMERRYQLLSGAGVRNLEGYNDRVCGTRLPRIVVVVDELADLLMCSRDIEPELVRLAQKARAAGIHLVLATQRPSSDVVTGIIKANCPARIAYKVSQREDSRTVLGRAGAELLLGRGDLLMLAPGSTELRRVHGAYVADEEIHALCEQLRGEGTPHYEPTLLEQREAPARATALPMLRAMPMATVHALPSARSATGELYTRAIALVTSAGYCSTSLLQRELSLGYNRAAKLVERMERERIVGAGSTGGRRPVLASAVSEEVADEDITEVAE
jgi:DNA segregation ATPase FtsK/SpoIIIE, S-DNA-T family